MTINSPEHFKRVLVIVCSMISQVADISEHCSLMRVKGKKEIYYSQRTKHLLSMPSESALKEAVEQVSNF